MFSAECPVERRPALLARSYYIRRMFLFGLYFFYFVRSIIEFKIYTVNDSMVNELHKSHMIKLIVALF